MAIALEVARAGETCESAEAPFRDFTIPRGVVKTSRIGYTIGNGWGERTANLRRGDLTVLQPKMTFHLMLGF